MRSPFSWVVMVGVAVAGSSFAEPPAELAKAARDLSMVVLSPANWKKTVGGISEDVARQLASLPGPNHPDAAAVLREMNQLLPYDELIDLQTSLLVKHYTLAEVKELAAFYQTALGEKVLRVMPEIARDVNADVQLRIQRNIGDVMKRLKAPSGSSDPAPSKAAPLKR